MLYHEYVNQTILRDRAAEHQRSARRPSSVRPTTVFERRRRHRRRP